MKTKQIQGGDWGNEQNWRKLGGDSPLQCPRLEAAGELTKRINKH